MLTDSHCHLDDERLAPSVVEIVGGMREDGLKRVVTVGCNAESSAKCLELATAYEGVYATVGIHPHDADTLTEDFLSEAERAARNPKVLAIGEIGLDYFYDLSPREVQKSAFLRQVELADALGLPVAVHLRDAYEDFYKAVKDNLRLFKNGLLLHCYSGSPEFAAQMLRLTDTFFAFGGALTFKNARVPCESLRHIPDDRFFLETDSPYMTPVPFRGKTNLPKYVALVADKAAEIKNTDRRRIESITENNLKSFFKRLI